MQKLQKLINWLLKLCLLFNTLMEGQIFITFLKLKYSYFIMNKELFLH